MTKTEVHVAFEFYPRNGVVLGVFESLEECGKFVKSHNGLAEITTLELIKEKIKMVYLIVFWTGSTREYACFLNEEDALSFTVTLGHDSWESHQLEVR